MVGSVIVLSDKSLESLLRRGGGRDDEFAARGVVSRIVLNCASTVTLFPVTHAARSSPHICTTSRLPTSGGSRGGGAPEPVSRTHPSCKASLRAGRESGLLLDLSLTPRTPCECALPATVHHRARWEASRQSVSPKASRQSNRGAAARRLLADCYPHQLSGRQVQRSPRLR